MFVRGFWLLAICLVSGTSNVIKAQDYDPVMQDIEALNDRMEEYFRNNQLEKIGELYLEDAYMLTPEHTIQGGAEITQYWKNIKNPVDWDLNVIEVSHEENELYLNEFYEALDNKPPGWRVRGIEFDHDKPLIYQLGHSTLTTKNEEGELQQSDVDFLLIWRVMPDGTYKILMDSYTWQTAGD